MATRRPDRTDMMAAFLQEEQEALALSGDPLLIKRAFVEIPSLVAYWAGKYAAAAEVAANASVHAKRTTARLAKKYRHELALDAKAGGAKVTEGLIEASVQDDDDWVTAQMALIEAEAEATRVRGVWMGVQAKRDMVVELGATYRAEVKSNPMIREDTVRDRDGG